MTAALRDGGARSRKLWYAVGTSVGIIACAGLCAYVPALIPLFDTMVGGLIGVFALYAGANVGAKHVLKKTVQAPVEGSPPV
jgi:hypothetical protein